MKFNKDFRECMSVMTMLIMTEQFLRVAEESELPDMIKCAVPVS